MGGAFMEDLVRHIVTLISDGLSAKPNGLAKVPALVEYLQTYQLK
jgi:hypothetical protein